MKTTFKFIIAAMAAISVFASCQKEMSIETANNTNDTVRVISAQFDNSTKASLDGYTPSFENNDQIRVSNSEKSEECTVTVSGSTVSFTTTLSGALTAIYPADAAILSSAAANAPIATSNDIKVSTSQSGLVKDAIIAKATVAAEENTATFYGQTAVFRITPGAGTNTKYVEVITAGPEIANTTTTEYPKKNKIHVATTTTTAAYEVFVSVLVPDGGLKLRDLSFADGSNIKTVNDATNGTKAIEVNTIYTITSSDWDEPYVEIEMTVGTKTQKYKWATKNIGANSATEAGTYFAWGDVVGQVPSGSTFDSGFSWSNCPFAVGGTYKFNKYVPASKTSYLAEGFSGDTKTVLDLADDAANVNWGGSWRMPTKAEFDALAGMKRGTFASGYHFGGTSESGQIFLPAAGFGYGTDLFDASDFGYYWSSSLITDNPIYAFYLYFYDGGASTRGSSRYLGRSVRALSE